MCMCVGAEEGWRGKEGEGERREREILRNPFNRALIFSSAKGVYLDHWFSDFFLTLTHNKKYILHLDPLYLYEPI